MSTSDDLAADAAKHLLQAQATYAGARGDLDEVVASALIGIGYALLALRPAGDEPPVAPDAPTRHAVALGGFQ